EQEEALFEVSTDKVDSEVPSPGAGVVAEIRVPEGETVGVGTVLAVISSGEAPQATSGVPASAGPDRPPAPTEPDRPPEPAPAAAVDAERQPSAPSEARGEPDEEGPALTSPVVRRLIAEHGLDASTIRGTGEGGRVTRRDVLDAAAARTAPAP